MQFDFLKTIVGLLNDAGVDHMLAGSMASTFHGEPRMTRDIDVVIAPDLAAIDRFVASLDRSRFYVGDLAAATRRSDMANVIDTTSGWKADLIIRKSRPFSVEEFRRRRPATIGGVDLFVATAEDTILAKLEWHARSGSDQQMRDVIAILAVQALDTVYLERWASELHVMESLQRAVEAAEG